MTFGGIFLGYIQKKVLSRMENPKGLGNVLVKAVCYQYKMEANVSLGYFFYSKFIKKVKYLRSIKNPHNGGGFNLF